MHRNDEREIIGSLKSLSQLYPPAESFEKMQHLLDERLQPPRRIFAAMIALAAVLLVAVTITSVLLFRPHTASAAENLLQVAQANKSFKGWVRIGSDDPKLSGGIYYNTTDYSHGGVYSNGPNGNAHFIDKVARRSTQYEPEKNTIYIGNINPDEINESFEDIVRRIPVAVDIQAVLDRFQRDNPEGNYKVRQSTDGGYERYDVEFDPKHTQILWVDPKTKLLVKLRADYGDHAPIINHYWYNDPVVHDIYDLGVPRSAKIVDNRPAGELKEVLDRLDRKIERGMGDGVAVLTKQIFRNNELPGGIGQLELYGESGPRWVWYRFNVGSWKLSEITGMASEGPPIDAPHDWPAIAGVQPLLSRLQTHIASEAFVSNGHNTRRIEESSLEADKLTLQELDEHWSDSEARHHFGLPGRFSFGSYAFEFYQPTTAGHIVHDGAHGNLIGIDILANDNTRHFILWIDPARDDVPVEYSCKKTNEKGAVYSAETIQYTAWGQTPDKRWYSSRWGRELKWNSPTLKDALHENCFLVFDAKSRLDAEWFSNPMKHFGPVTEPAEPAVPATQRGSTSAPAG